MTGAAAAVARTRGPGIRAALRTAIVDMAFHPWRAIALNAIWGTGLIVLLALATAGAPLLALVLSPLLAVPTAGIYRVAALIARDRPVSAWDGVRLERRVVLRALLVGTLVVIGVSVLVVNAVVGLESGAPGWAIATLAAWGLVGGSVWLVHLWPLLVDPDRSAVPLIAIATEALTVGLARPGRAAVLGVVTALILLVAGVLFAALIMLALSYVALLGCRWVLPAADALRIPSARS